ncbi:MAG: hypothetical protein B6D38_11255 [Anaerolineae bacterium UTCFX1]|nr:MAG: hypothetical protein B6D38_11255 [Anaerolineae bacterium UTCFX1]
MGATASWATLSLPFFCACVYTSDMPIYFTLEEANRALETIRPLIHEAMLIRRRVLADQPEVWAMMEKAAGNGGSPTLSKMVVDFERFDDLLHAIQAAGAQIKDISAGLMDFPALKEGREVCLCWRYGETDIAYWHEVETGFAGRQPIATF